jgi:hypothetical protein
MTYIVNCDIQPLLEQINTLKQSLVELQTERCDLFAKLEAYDQEAKDDALEHMDDLDHNTEWTEDQLLYYEGQLACIHR